MTYVLKYVRASQWIYQQCIRQLIGIYIFQNKILKVSQYHPDCFWLIYWKVKDCSQVSDLYMSISCLVFGRKGGVAASDRSDHWITISNDRFEIKGGFPISSIIHFTL